MTKQPQRVLPADVYDALEFSALVFGGIGGGKWNKGEEPWCFVGHLAACEVIPNVMAMEPFGISEEDNDNAIMALAGQNWSNKRVPFKKWCEALNVVRGEA